MKDNYARIVESNLEKLFSKPVAHWHRDIGAEEDGGECLFRAFGRDCRLGREGILLDGEKQTGVLGILISLYALAASPESFVEQPFRAFKEFPDSMPYAGAFTNYTEQALVPAVSGIRENKERIAETLDGGPGPENVPGDFSILVFPLPKIALCCIFYEADDDFPAGATCLYSNNADRFMPIDGLADVGEYTSKRILDIVEQIRR